MSNSHEIQAEVRNDEGKGASRRLRRSGFVPAVVYGGHEDPKSIQLEHRVVWHASQNEWFYSSLLNLMVDGKGERVLLRDMQRHPYKQQIMHIDFQRIPQGEVIRVRVPLHYTNQKGSPAGKTSGVVISHNLNDVEVSCLPRHLPEFIEVDLSALKPGELVHLSEIKLPEGVEIPELKLGKEHDIAIVAATYVREEPAEDEAADEADADVPASKQSKDDED